MVEVKTSANSNRMSLDGAVMVLVSGGLLVKLLNRRQSSRSGPSEPAAAAVRVMDGASPLPGSKMAFIVISGPCLMWTCGRHVAY